MHDLDPSFAKGIREANEAYLDSESEVFLNTVAERLRSAQHASESFAGKGYDIFLVRTESSNIGNIECHRMRFTPAVVNQSRDTTVTFPGQGAIKQLVVEVPKFFDDRTLDFVFTTVTTNDGQKFHHAVSKKRILEVDPHEDGIELFLNDGGAFILYRTSDLRGVSHYEDLDARAATDDEIAERVMVIRLLSDVVAEYKVANQSRADGTAES